MWFRPGPHHVPPCGHMWKIRSGPDRNLGTSLAISARVDNFAFKNSNIIIEGLFWKRKDYFTWKKFESRKNNFINKFYFWLNFFSYRFLQNFKKLCDCNKIVCITRNKTTQRIQLVRDCSPRFARVINFTLVCNRCVSSLVMQYTILCFKFFSCKIVFSLSK